MGCTQVYSQGYIEDRMTVWKSDGMITFLEGAYLNSPTYTTDSLAPTRVRETCRKLDSCMPRCRSIHSWFNGNVMYFSFSSTQSAKGHKTSFLNQLLLVYAVHLKNSRNIKQSLFITLHQAATETLFQIKLTSTFLHQDKPLHTQPLHMYS